MLVALVALLLAMGAPSYAAQTLRSIFFAKHAGNANKVDGFRASSRPHPNTLLALDSQGKFPPSVGLAGPRGALGTAGPQGAQGPQGPTGPLGDRGYQGAPGSALAFAVILFAPPDEGGPAVWRIDDSSAKKLDNDVNFTRAAPGVYCLHDVPFTVMNAVATPGPFGTTVPGGKVPPFLVQVDIPSTGQPANSACPANSNAAVYVTDPSGNLEDPPDPSDTIYFELN